MKKCLLKAQRKIIANLVKKCFANVEWNVNHFSTGSILMTDKKGNDKFYSVKEIDKGIKRLNRLLRLLNS